MNGAGNDFILLDAIAEPFDEAAAPALARALCDRRRSIGADGLMLVTRAVLQFRRLARRDVRQRRAVHLPLRL